MDKDVLNSVSYRASRRADRNNQSHHTKGEFAFTYEEYAYTFF